MGIPAILESAIALFFVFLLVSLLITAANELLSSLLGLRAKKLKEGIRTMLGGSENVVAKVFSHPLVSLATKTSKRGPSYMPADYFPEILCDYIAGAGEYAVLGAHYAEGFDLEAAIGKAPLPEEVKALVSSFAKAAENDVEAFKAKLGAWFDRTMERVYGWYSRMMRLISFGLGLAIAVGANIDSVALATSFARDVSARQAIANKAVSFVANAQPEDIKSGAVLSEKLKASLSAETDNLASASLIGWGPGVELFASGSGTGPSLGDILLKIFGFLATAVAASMGAPFWFDVLGKLANVRSSMPAAAKSGGEDGKDGADGEASAG